MNSTDGLIIKKFKKLFIKKVEDSKTIRKSFGKQYKALLYCFTEDGNFYSRIIKYDNSFKQPSYLQIEFENKKLFKESLFEGEYFDGVFYITNILSCELNKEDIVNSKILFLNDCCENDCQYEYVFNHLTFEESYNKIEKTNKKNIIKDSELIEIYRVKETNEIVRVKNICISKKLRNIFYNNENSIELPVIFNERFKKLEITDF